MNVKRPTVARPFLASRLRASRRGHPTGPSGLLLALVAVGLTVPGPAIGQESDDHVFVASVFDEETRQPVIAAFVAAVEQDLITTTDKNGSFRLTGLPK